MENTSIRRITPENALQTIPGIVHIFRDDADITPWQRYDTCLPWVTHRLARGFYLTAAYSGAQLVGYSEWIETRDDGEKILYLSLMQVDSALRSRGIGKLLLDDGEAYAKSIGATRLRTMPEDSRSYNFYQKYGFNETDLILKCTCPCTESGKPPQSGDFLPLTLDIVNSHTFIFGLWQSSGRYLYEAANHSHEPEHYTIKTITLPEGYLQLRALKGESTAEVLYWSNKDPRTETVSLILAHGHAEGFKELEFFFRTKHKPLFAAYSTKREGEELEKVINKKGYML